MSVFGMQTEVSFAQIKPSLGLPMSVVAGQTNSSPITLEGLKAAEGYIRVIDSTYQTGFDWGAYNESKNNFMDGSNQVNLEQILKKMNMKNLAIMVMGLANTQAGEDYILIEVTH
jgi:hypothetical protein